MQSYPTPIEAVGIERMNGGFVKLHPGPPVHIFTEAADEQYHDHPFNFTSHIVAGSYTEEVLHIHGMGYHVETFHRQAGTSHEVQAGTIHRITGLPDGFCVSRAEYGPTVRKPGFYELREDGLYHRYHDSQEWTRMPLGEEWAG